MKKSIFSLVTMCLPAIMYSQIVKTSIVEHFTNSSCGSCAATNPGVFTTLNANPNVLHISFYPSSPYASCFFSMQNAVDNDARTNHYGIYGSTPRFILNGTPSTPSVLGASIIAQATTLTNFQIFTTQEFVAVDSVNVKVVIKKVSADTTTSAKLFAGAMQDTVMQTTANGESNHKDVFRKALTDVMGSTISLPIGINDSIILNYAYKIPSNWVANRMNTICILQQLNKQVINASKSINIITPPISTQILKTSIVEHFTNSNCGVCAATNPSIFSILNVNPNVLHIAYHPSSPYANCFFSMQNPTENDARTNYYNIYGGTPRVVLNGINSTPSVLSASVLAQSSSLTSYSIASTQEFINLDSVKVSIIIKKVSTDTSTTAILFAGTMQDTVQQATPNGESIHQNVFRKSLTNSMGNTINLPIAVNDSVVLNFGYKVLNNWEIARMNTIGILQKVNKEVINATKSINKNNVPQLPNSIGSLSKRNDLIYPNPANHYISINKSVSYNAIEIYNSFGQIVYHTINPIQKIDVSNLSVGNYFIKLTSSEVVSIAQLQIVH